MSDVAALMWPIAACLWAWLGFKAATHATGARSTKDATAAKLEALRDELQVQGQALLKAKDDIEALKRRGVAKLTG